MKKVLQPRGLSSVSANKICVYPQQYTIKCGSSNQKKWPLSCHFFWCKLTLTFQLKQLEANISLVLNVGHFYTVSLQINTIKQNIVSKAVEGLRQYLWQFSYHQIHARILKVLSEGVQIWHFS